MDFDNRKVYGDTSITDGLVSIIIYHYLSLKVVLFFALSVYFILSVYSLYMILKIQKKSVTTFLDHEFQQGSKI